MECDVEDGVAVDSVVNASVDIDHSVNNTGISDDEIDYDSVDEMLLELSKSVEESKVKPKYKALPIQTNSTKKSPSPSGSNNSYTIRHFFPNISKQTDSPTPSRTSTHEYQEKRPRSLMVTSLDNDYNRKCAKLDRHTIETAAQNHATDFDEVENQEVSPKGNPTTQMPSPPQEQSLENEPMEDSSEIMSEKPNSDCNDLNATRWTASDMFDDFIESVETPEPNNDDSVNTKNSPTPSKVNNRPRGQFKYQEPRLTEPSSPNSSTVCSAPSSEDILTPSGTKPNNNNDQANSDLNSEADQLMTLNVTSDK